jgi:glycosyltransferase involved in cell wall biosynthesis
LKLKILVITARYPPYHFGGYEIRSNDIMDELFHRGHNILVITSIKETSSKSLGRVANYKILRKLHIRNKNYGVIGWLINRNRNRMLNLLLAFTSGLIHDLQDTRIIDQQINNFQPDVIYTGHISCLSRTIMPYLGACKIPTVHDEGGAGLIDLREQKGIWYKFVEEYVSRYSILNTLKSFVINFICIMSGNRIKSQWVLPDNLQIIFNSELNYKHAITRGVPVRRAKVIHSGVNTEKFSFLPRTNFGTPLSIIVPGRIESRKGQINAVRMLANLLECDIDGNMVIVGENWSNSYYLELENEIKELCLEKKITIVPMVGQNQLITLYKKADICFFPSYQEIGLSRVPFEAMACGCIVFSYGYEGSDEIIRNKQTGFLVASEEYQEITNLVKEMILTPTKAIEVTHNARKSIEENYSMEKYVDEIEETLIGALNSK